MTTSGTNPLVRAVSARSVCIALALSLAAVVGCSGPNEPERESEHAAVRLSVDTTSGFPNRRVELIASLQVLEDLPTGVDSISRFEFLILYEEAALTFTRAWPLSGLRGWESFTWEYRVQGGGPIDPFGQVRVIGVRDLPDSLMLDPSPPIPEGSLFGLEFQIGTDYRRIGSTAIVGFGGDGCHDNTLVFAGDENVMYVPVTADKAGLIGRPYDPTNCPNKFALRPLLTFVAGNVKTPGPNPGDLNLDGDQDVLDLIIFVDYLRYGESELAADSAVRALQIAAADVNGDERPFTVADFDMLLGVAFRGVEIPPVSTPFTDTLFVDTERRDDGVLVYARGSKRVSMLQVDVRRDGANPGLRWLKLDQVDIGFYPSGPFTTRFIVGSPGVFSPPPVIDTVWEPCFFLPGSLQSPPMIESIAASTPPGVLMAVEFVQRRL